MHHDRLNVSQLRKPGAKADPVGPSSPPPTAPEHSASKRDLQILFSHKNPWSSLRDRAPNMDPKRGSSPVFAFLMRTKTIRQHCGGIHKSHVIAKKTESSWYTLHGTAIRARLPQSNRSKAARNWSGVRIKRHESSRCRRIPHRSMTELRRAERICSISKKKRWNGQCLHGNRGPKGLAESKNSLASAHCTQNCHH